MKSILVIDDFSTMRAATAFPLKFAGFHVIEAENGTDALEYLESKDAKVDMIITDFNMPGMSGVDVIRAVRASNRFKYVPIVVLSTQSREKEVKEAGGTAFIKKPFVFNSFLEVIKKLLR